jgi:hypothetical protein
MMTGQKILMGWIIVGLFLATTLISVQAGELIDLGPQKCKPGLHFQPNGPFAVILFCEDALGSHLGVVYYSNMGVPLNGKWSLTDRFWQKSAWGADVTSLAWDSTGKDLFVSTSAIYGSGAVYRLDLLNREAKKLFPQVKYAKETKLIKEVCLTNIRGVDEKKQTLDVLIEDCDLTTNIPIRIKY